MAGAALCCPSPMETQRIHNYRLTLEYDGSRFSGWQEQKNAPTVVGELKKALAEAGMPALELGGSGRTDAGVHALAQVAHLKLGRKLDGETLANTLNARLPTSIQVLRAEPADPRFHSRHDAVSRSYLYQIATRRTAFGKRTVWWVREGLDLAALRAAAAKLVGRHDFRQFCEPGEPGASTLVEVEGVEVVLDGALVLVRITASHFLWKMVRRLVGCLVRVATGALSARDFDLLLAGSPMPAGEGNPAAWTAPASGLFLEHVRYAAAEPLPRLVAATPVRQAPPPQPTHEPGRPRREGPRPSEAARPRPARSTPGRGPRKPPRQPGRRGRGEG